MHFVIVSFRVAACLGARGWGSSPRGSSSGEVFNLRGLGRKPRSWRTVAGPQTARGFACHRIYSIPSTHKTILWLWNCVQLERHLDDLKYTSVELLTPQESPVFWDEWWVERKHESGIISCQHIFIFEEAIRIYRRWCVISLKAVSETATLATAIRLDQRVCHCWRIGRHARSSRSCSRYRRFGHGLSFFESRVECSINSFSQLVNIDVLHLCVLFFPC